MDEDRGDDEPAAWGRLVTWLRTLCGRVIGPFKADRERDLEVEVQEHLARLYNEHRCKGLEPAAAREAARRDFGSVLQMKETHRDQRAWRWVEELRQDVRYALRTLRRSPAFTFAAATTLALGIGANTAIFSLIYQALLRPLPYAADDRLVFIWSASPRIGLFTESLSPPDYLERKARAAAIEDAAAFSLGPASLSGDDRSEQVIAVEATASFFSTLGRAPALGRVFNDEETIPGNDRFAVLTHHLWVSRYGADPAIVGRQIRVNAESHTVLGVMPPDFTVPNPYQALAAVAAQDAPSLILPLSRTQEQLSDRSTEFLVMIARLRPDASVERLTAELQTLVAQDAARLPAVRARVEQSGFSAHAVPMREQLIGDTRFRLYILQAAVVVVLLIICANLGNLFLIRGAGRSRELAVRSVLGAGSWRIVRQLLTESLLLAAIGGAVGLLVGTLSLRLLRTFAASQLPGVPDARLDPVVLMSTVVLCLAAAAAFGVGPSLALVRQNNLSAAVREQEFGSSSSRTAGFTRNAIVTAQMCLAVVLLIGAGLLAKSLMSLQNVQPGFSTTQVVTFGLFLPEARYVDPNARRQFWDRLLEKVRAVHGVTSVGLVSMVPLSGTGAQGNYGIVGHTPAPSEPRPHAYQGGVDGDYFRAMGIPLISGRYLDDAHDAEGTPRAVVVDEILARRYFPHGNAVGQQIRRGGTFTIVGVVGAVSVLDLAQPVTKERIYFSFSQLRSLSPIDMGGFLVVRSALDPAALVPQVRAIVGEIDPDQPVAMTRTTGEWVSRSLEGRRIPTVLLVLFSALTVVLAGLGVYGILAFSVTQRSRELGIRRALGADVPSMLSLVLSQVFKTAGVGIVIGTCAALALSRYLESQLFNVGAQDPGVFVGAATLLLSVALASALAPARRALRIDPARVLKEG